MLDKYKVCQLHLSLIVHVAPLKGAVSQQSSSFCLILPITRPQSLWNLKLANKLLVNDEIRDPRQTSMSSEHYC